MILAVIAFLMLFVGTSLFPLFTGHAYKPPEFKSLVQAKQIVLACKQYQIDNDGKYPPSLDDLIPAYLTDRSVFVSPLNPKDPAGYIYTVPARPEVDSSNTIVLEDKFAPSLFHQRIVVYADDSARVERIP